MPVTQTDADVLSGPMFFPGRAKAPVAVEFRELGVIGSRLFT
jgi:hypothetical protein